MTANKIELKEKFLDYWNKINKRIIPSYETLKDSNFHIAIPTDKRHFKEFIMKNGVFNYLYIESYISDYIGANIPSAKDVSKFINENGRNNLAWRLCPGTVVDPSLKFKIYKDEDNYIEHVKVTWNNSFFNMEDFFNYLARSSDKESIKLNLNLLSSLPKDMINAYEKYCLNIKNKTEQTNKEIANLASIVNKNIETFDSSYVGR